MILQPLCKYFARCVQLDEFILREQVGVPFVLHRQGPVECLSFPFRAHGANARASEPPPERGPSGHCRVASFSGLVTSGIDRSRWEGASGFRGRPRDGRRVGSGLHEGIPCRRIPLLRPRAGRRRASWRRDVSARSRSPEPDLAVATDRRSRFSVRRGSLGPSSVAHALRPTLTLVVEAPGAASCSKHARDRTRLKPDQIQGSPSFGRRNHIMHECDIHFCARGVGRSGHRRVDVGRHDLEDASTPSEGGCARETRARPVRPGQMRKRFCERRHQTDVNRQAVGVFPCRTLYLASEPVAREILFRMTARPKRCIHWR
jgi:hypothetical protein